MKVLQIIISLRTGGAEVLVSQLHAKFRERGVDCAYYLLHSDGGALEEKLRAEGAQIFAPLKASVYSPLHVLALARHLRSHSYDVIHVHLFAAQLWTAMAAILAHSDVPLITTEHSTVNRRRGGIWRPFDRLMYSRYQHVACISAATKESLVKWCPWTADKVLVCSNGVDLDQFETGMRTRKAITFGLGESDIVILSVGRLEPPKDPETILRAFSFAPGAHLVFAGAGRLQEEMQSLARALGIAERVHFLGIRRDIPELLKAADIFVQSSRWEGFGISALEAMASGLPVVASNVPGLAEVVGDSGLLFTAGDSTELSAHLKKLLHDEELRKDLSRRAQIRARQFSLSHTRDSYESLYREALRTRRAGAEYFEHA